jgi:DNA-binding MarR family transcriptional regulator
MDELLNELFVDLFRLILIKEERNLKEQGLDLSISEVHVLEAIEKSSQKTMSEVANNLLITVGSLTTSVKTLENKGYLQRYQAPTDKRFIKINLLPKAYDVLGIHKQFHEKMINSMKENLPVYNDEQLYHSLKQVMNYFKNDI